MRKLIYTLVVVSLVVSCNQPDEKYSLRVNLENSGGKYIKLLYVEDRKYVVFDSVLAVTGSFAEMTGHLDGLRTMYLTMENSYGTIQLLMENSSYEISGSLEDPVITSDSKAQNDLNGYSEGLRPIDDQMNRVRNAMIAQSENKEMRDSLRDVYYTLYDLRDNYDSVYMAGHPDSYASVIALREIFYMYDAEGLETVLSSLDPSFAEMKEYQYMKGKLERMKAVAVGQPFPDFGMQTPEGEMLRVSDVHHDNLLLIDFWASWCGPCRRANPEMIEIYNDYRGRGFDILGVSLDRDYASWVKAIADDRLPWHQISDLKYWNSEGAEIYGVAAIPYSVLIDREGKIAARDLHGTELRKAIESLL